MSQFSEYLKERINSRGSTIKSLADSCGMERTTLQKIIVGSRKPANKDVVIELADHLMLSKEDKSYLIKLYNIAAMGEEIYNRRRNVAEIIYGLSHRNFKSDSQICFKTSLDIANVPVISTYYDQKDFLRNVEVIISYETQNNSDISIIAQPSKKLNSVLKYCLNENNKVDIKHIFCMDNTSNEKRSNSYNLNILSNVLDLTIENNQYKPYYYYDSARSHLNSTNLMPYVIITENFVISSDVNFSCGIISKSEKHVAFYQKQFKSLLSKSKKLMENMNDAESFMTFYKSSPPWEICYNYASCFLIAINKDIVYKNIKGPDKLKDMAWEAFNNVTKMQLGQDYINIFSEKGLVEFLDTGIVADLPLDSYIPVSVEDRKMIVSRMIELIESDAYNYRIVKDPRCMFENHLCISYMNGAIEFQFIEDECNYSIRIYEQSLGYAFKDYINYLYESDNIYTKEETITLLEKYL